MIIILLFLFFLQIIINDLSLFLGNLYLAFFTFIGRLVHANIYFAETFYKKYHQFEERTKMQNLLLKKELSLKTAANKLLKSQLKNTGYKKCYSFIQKLFVIILYLIYTPDAKQVKLHLTHKIKTIKNYIAKIRKFGLFSLISKPSFKKTPHNKKSINIVRQVWLIHNNNPSWGRFKIAFQMFLLGYSISPSTVRNILNSKKPPQKNARKYKKTASNSNKHNNNKINAKSPNHTWNIDFTTIKVLFIDVYIFFVLDIYSRKLIYFDISLFNPTSFWTITRIKRAFSESIDTPKYIISDNGSQFISAEFKLFCKDYDISHRRSAVHSWRSTAHIERFNETIKYEALYNIPLFSINYLRKMIYSFIDYYNNYRPHMALNGLTPQMKYNNIETPHDPSAKTIRQKTFCDGLITAFFLDNAA